MQVFAMIPHFLGSFTAVIAWIYLVSNSTRVFSYLPQILAIWRCRDGARSISLWSWTSWSISHVTAGLYGMVVAHDAYLVLISVLNLVGCAAVTLVAARRRGLLRGRRPAAQRTAA
ncbi:hypothetical protein [Variovorax sp. PBL-E5]|uniref:hypothetical protein n=1 Tax=Variovorax sp. PBL-E5 TaxID=434014 RepID=UPI0013165305|nr:hypothetical protein [Variovorax sp. PBL-E5]VTU39327.1 hypothetical protein E5CHR_05051 [Variovorax sp. PBL-E5]